MQLTNILGHEAVKVVTSVTSKKRLFQEIGELAHNVLGLDATATVDALLDRESLGPTGVGHGVALPHARMAGIDRVAGVFILLEKPIDFGAVDRQPVDIVFALFAPEQAGVEHLKALALVARTLRDPSLCSKLRANPDSSTVYAILTASQSIAA
ncbi:PTS sugar transporter subunit IIA [Pontibaca salina]|uniref:PTS sugar transporter subunit IIA n=1 Tax=Pontibaca salina TaxID=2795731 RepID=A0A934M0A6_9RHOB|nr:PTS sugar transporter subunit IIA [Pontibaca salina]MBI6628466.1 PTS sugar transporter subunit IIA [Pontibaca salina]